MYEIWLALNIAYEFVCSIQPISLIVLLAVAGMFGTALLRQRAAWRRGFAVAAAIWFATTLVLVLTLPAMTKASLTDVAYVVDWIILFGIAASFALVPAMLAWPLSATLMRRQSVQGDAGSSQARPLPGTA